MILVDEDIKKRARQGALIVEGFDEKNVGPVSYDLTLNKIIAFTPAGTVECEEFDLPGGAFCIVQTKEKIHMPDQLIGRIEEKNSILRLGLMVSGPCYQPGHETYCYLRVYNITKQQIKLTRGFVIAQILFEELSGAPGVTYDQKENASFNREFEYAGYGKYEEDFLKRIV